MDFQQVQVLRCKLCRKPFDKPSSLKRHGYYCRSREVAKAVRRRSCTVCASAKARCDGVKPDCSRCLAKGIVCQWPDLALPSIENTAKTANHGLVTVTHDNYTKNVDATQIHNFDTTILPAQDIWTNSSNIFQPDSFLDLGLFEMPGTFRPPISPLKSIPDSPSTMIRTLTPHATNTSPAFQRTSRLIMSTLKSYATGLIRHNTLPPFIHPNMLSLDIGPLDSIEPLHNCINLALLARSGEPGGRKLFWRNVKMECERFIGTAQAQTPTPWELLATMQALTIYLLIRLQEGETEDNNLDALLVKSVILISLRFHQSDKDKCNTLAKCQSCHQGDERSWGAWILRESRRRLAVVYRIMSMLLYFEPASICNLPKTLLIAPLPARKELWEAANEGTWTSGIGSHSNASKSLIKRSSTTGDDEDGEECSFGMTAGGELIRLDESKDSALSKCADWWMSFKDPQEAVKMMPSMSVASWEDWCADMDALGGLVLLAASLVE